MKPEKFVPEVMDDDRHVTLMAELNKCPICGEYMIAQPKNMDLFDLYPPFGIEAQAKSAGLKFMSNYTIPGEISEVACTECVEAGKIKFTCALCGKEQKTSKIHESIGYPAEYLCKNCYETVSVKEWAEKVEEMKEDHRWDYE